MNKRIFFIAPYPHGQAPSQRFRFEQYFEFIKNEGFDIEFHSFLSEQTWGKIYKEGSFVSKSMGILGSFAKRFSLLFKLRKVDYIFIHREASMIGPPIFEWIIAKILRKKYIYDFDDAIWLPNYSENNARFHRLKAYWKVKKIIKWADKVTVGNTFLMNYAKQYNQNVAVIPTTIDLENVHNQLNNQDVEPVNIGWTGTHTTMSYLHDLLPVFKELEKEYSFTFTIISNQAPDFPVFPDKEFKSLRFIKWNKETEISDLAKFNIGIMPLTEGPWAEGKCGFKGLQYMALGIPALMSPVGVNKEIIVYGENGFLCETVSEWKKQLINLITDKSLRQTIGNKGRETVAERYSVEANKAKYLELFTS